MRKALRVAFNMKRIAEHDWHIVAERPGADTVTIKGFKTKADVDVRSFAVADARLWNGADTVARSPRRLKARNTRTFAKCAARRREPASPLSTGRRGHQGKRRDGAPEGAPAPYGR